MKCSIYIYNKLNVGAVRGIPEYPSFIDINGGRVGPSYAPMSLGAEVQWGLAYPLPTGYYV
jgi:hypothetical protein